MLEVTHTVEARSMRPQYLDKLDLERERGITIKMAPVRMLHAVEGKQYMLNLIDTPGHSDFSYEVSRALAAVEGAVLLVDATKGIQAQTLSTLRAAEKAGLTLVGAVNKVDLFKNDPVRLEKTIQSVADLLKVSPDEIYKISAKTGEGVDKLLAAVVAKVPAPKISGVDAAQALIFDSLYDDHRGIIAFVRVFSGAFDAGADAELAISGAKFKTKELGYFGPELKAAKKLSDGEIGYIATGVKEPASVKIGDTIALSGPKGSKAGTAALPGYKEPGPVVFISFYPDGQTEFEDLEKGFERLRLNDAALSFEPDANDALGRGLKVGFLGQLHFEITASRLEREFNLQFLTSFPSIAYRIKNNGKEYMINQPQDFPAGPEKVWQPMIKLEIISPKEYLSQVTSLKNLFDLEIKEINNLGDNLLIDARMPLAELIRDFDDKIKSASAGFASFSYELDDFEEAEVEKLEILIVGEPVPALTRIVAKKDLDREARRSVERLKDLLPKEQFSQSIQARSGGRIIARETIPALKKKLGDFGKNGGDRTRKMKLWKKQERGKERLQQTAHVQLTPEVFREILKK